MAKGPIYPSTRLEGHGPPDWTLVIENGLDYPMKDLVIWWGSDSGPRAKDSRDELRQGDAWRLPLADHTGLFAHYYQKRKAYDRDIPYEVIWTDQDGVKHSFSNKAYLMDGLGEGPIAATTDDGLNPISKTIAFVISGAAAIWLLWCTIVAFTGGTLPLLGWEIEGGFLFGLVWVFLIDPIAMTVAYWVGMLLTLPLVLVSEGAGTAMRRKSR